MTTQSTGFGYLLSALDLYLRPSREVVIVGDPDDPATQALRQAVQERWLPDTVTAACGPENAAHSIVAPLQGRTLVDGKPAAYVCRNYVCNLPVTEPEALARQLQDSSTMQ
jgi:hypothetical protein